MTVRDRNFVLGVLLLSAVAVPGLLAARPFDETRATLGLLAGWGGALLIVLPSYVWLARALSRSEPQAFLRGFMGNATLRLFAALAVMTVFTLTVKDAPTASFLSSFMLGYLLLTGLELRLLLASSRKGASA